MADAAVVAAAAAAAGDVAGGVAASWEQHLHYFLGNAIQA